MVPSRDRLSQRAEHCLLHFYRAGAAFSVCFSQYLSQPKNGEGWFFTICALEKAIVTENGVFGGCDNGLKSPANLSAVLLL